MNHDIYRRFGKRSLDCILASIALLLLAPVMLPVALAVLVVMGRPIFFAQQRPGRGGKLFTLVKFRTMSAARSPAGALLPDERRLTRLGQVLRATSIDELPELWNIIRGDMSLVGPRPLLPEYLPRYTAGQARRHDVLPGLTGWAQIHGRNALAWDDRLELDVWYTKHVSFWLDVEIILRTVWQVLSRDGISAAGHATMPHFEGSCEAATLAARELPPGIVVIGAGGHAKVVIGALRAAGHEIAAAYDDNPRNWGRELMGVPVHGPIAALAACETRTAVIAIGDNHARRKIAEQLPLCWTAIIHPSAEVDPSAQIAAGAVIMAGAIVQADAEVGAHAIVNTAATVDHDCRVAPFVHLAPGVHLAGNVHVNEAAFVGIGAVVIPGKSIGRDTVVGAGSTVVYDLPGGVVAVGSPARPIKASPQRRAA